MASRRAALLLLLLASLLWLRTATFVVDFTEFAYVTRFGEPVALYDGMTEAGLHLKAPWPVDSVTRIDRRLQVSDLPAVESLTRDPANRTVDKTLTVEAFVTWRVPDPTAAERFIRSVGTPEQARRLLAPRVTGRLAAVVGSSPLDDLIGVTEGPAIDARAERFRARLLGEDGQSEPLRERVLDEYGIEIVDLRVRRFGYPEAVRASIAERIRSERSRKAAEYETDGKRQAADILSAADREARAVEADARAKKLLIEGQADAEADRLRNDAHSRDPEFYAFLAKLKAYQSMLGESRDMLLLSTRNPLFDLLLAPPKAANPTVPADQE